MNRLRLPLLVMAATAMLQAHPARAAVVSIKWNDQGHYEDHVHVQHGKLIEACTRLSTGDKVRWSFESRDAADFNIHYHAGHDVQYPTRQDGTQKAQGMLEVASPQEYCWMWSVKTDSGMDVKFSLDKTR